MTNKLTLSNGKSVSLDGIESKKRTKELLKEQGFKASEKVDKALIVLLDESGSMCGVVPGGRSKLETAWGVLKNELMPNMTNWTYGVIGFEGYGGNWEIYPCVDTTALIRMSTPMPGGSTPMLSALEMAWAWVRSYARQARFILLSDGVPTDSPKDNILSIARENASVPIDCVGIGSGSIEYDPVFLRELCTITGGEFAEVQSAKLLALKILELSPANRPLLGTVKGKP